MRIRILDPHCKKMDPNPDPDSYQGHFYKIYWIFLTKNNFQIFVLFFCIFLSQNFLNHEIFIIFLFWKVKDFGFRRKKCFLQFLVDILPLESWSMDPHIFAKGSQNLADPMDPDPDPKHCRQHIYYRNSVKSTLKQNKIKNCKRKYFWWNGKEEVYIWPLFIN